MKCIITQMTHEELDARVEDLSDYAIMALKHELLKKVKELSDELALRTMAEDAKMAEDATGVFTSW